jgi:hypothetical protein
MEKGNGNRRRGAEDVDDGESMESAGVMAAWDECTLRQQCAGDKDAVAGRKKRRPRRCAGDSKWEISSHGAIARARLHQRPWWGMAPTASHLIRGGMGGDAGESAGRGGQ